jgi:hypothetical protein
MEGRMEGISEGSVLGRSALESGGWLPSGDLSYSCVTQETVNNATDIEAIPYRRDFIANILHMPARIATRMLQLTRFAALALPAVAWFASFVEPCPHLPACDLSRPIRHGSDRGVTFYFDALCFAQGHWLEGKPAQAILQLNRAFSAELSDDDPILETWPWPYAALEWILENSADGGQGFLGNPVRHFQHLATRMSGPRQEIRIAHAWRCFHIARRVLDGKGDFPLDGRQLAREGIFIPSGK